MNFIFFNEKVLVYVNESDLTLNAQKCEVFFVSTPPDAQQEMIRKLNQLLPGIEVLDVSAFQLLGASILDDGIMDMLNIGLDKVKTPCNRLPLAIG